MVLTLTDEVLSQMGMGAVFKSSDGEHVTSIDFHSSGEFCATANANGSVQLFNCREGKLMRTVHSKKYGVDLLRMTHHNQSVLCSSKNTSNDHDLRYLSLYDNKYLRFFHGHTDRVVSLSMSPIDDAFISGSLDGTVRLWNLRSERCQAVLRIPTSHGKGLACTAFDPTGVVFVATTGDDIRLFDVRQYDKGPFTSFKPELSSDLWRPTSIEFSSDGQHMLVATDQGLLLRLDAYDGRTVNAYRGHDTAGGGYAVSSVPFTPCFSPDCNFVLSGSNNGNIFVWDASSGREVCQWTGHVGPVHSVRWNPTSAMVASGCSNTAMWITQPPK
jgi:COMPASS component SWD2